MKKYLSIIVILILNNQLYSQQGWQYQNSNLTIFNQYGAIFPINKDTVYVIADNGKFLKTYNGGINWTEQNTGYSESFFDLAFCDNDTGYAVGINGIIIKSIDGGINWSSLTSGTSKNLFSIYINSPSDIWAVGDSGIILNSNDFGDTWLLNDTLTDNKLNSIKFKNSNIGFIAGDNGLLLNTLNGGIDWDTLNISTSKDLFSITITDNYAYLLAGWVNDYSYDSDELFETSDYINWTNTYLETTIPGLSKLYFQNDSLGFCISSNCTTNGDCGIIINKTTDFGQNWINSFNDWNPPFSVGIAYSDIVFITDSIGYALCGNNILKTNDGGVFVNVKELYYNSDIVIYPNPTKGTIRIESDKTIEQIEVLDINGRIVKQIVIASKAKQSLTNTDSHEQSSRYDVQTIDLRNEAKGIYFVKLIGESGVSTQRVVLE